MLRIALFYSLLILNLPQTAQDRSYDVVIGGHLHMECLQNMETQTQWTKDGNILADCGIPGRKQFEPTTKSFVDITDVEICDIGTYKCCGTTGAEPACNQHTVRVLVFRGASGKLGGSKRLYDIWINSESANTDDKDASKIGGNSSLHYKSEIVEKWDDYDIENVKLSVHENGDEKAFFIFKGSNTNKLNWMSGHGLIGSSYTDVVRFFPVVSTRSGQYVSIEGLQTRKFYINKSHGGCPWDKGWLAVITNQDICEWTSGKYPNILYSPTTESTKWSYGRRSADELIISLLLTERCAGGCLNGGNCLGSNQCQCKGGWEGQNCEKDASATDESTRIRTTTTVESKSTSAKYTYYSPTSTTTHGSGTTTDKVTTQCMCPCKAGDTSTQQFYASLNNYTYEELWDILQPMLRTMRRAMTVNKSQTSMNKRKLYSAPDSRSTSKQIGIIGITFICIVISLIVLVDVTWICRRFGNPVVPQTE